MIQSVECDGRVVEYKAFGPRGVRYFSSEAYGNEGLGRCRVLILKSCGSMRHQQSQHYRLELAKSSRAAGSK